MYSIFYCNHFHDCKTGIICAVLRKERIHIKSLRLIFLFMSSSGNQTTFIITLRSLLNSASVSLLSRYEPTRTIANCTWEFLNMPPNAIAGFWMKKTPALHEAATCWWIRVRSHRMRSERLGFAARCLHRRRSTTQQSGIPASSSWAHRHSLRGT